MTRNLLRAGALSCALLTSTSLCTSPAFAQTHQQELVRIPADHFAISPGGVDMRSGRYVYQHTDLTIGGGGEGGGLSLVRSMPNSLLGHINPFANFSHNFAMMVSEIRLSFETGGPGNDYRIGIVGGGLTDSFRSCQNCTGYGQISGGRRARLTFTGTKSGAAVYTYTAPDGTQAVFRPIDSADCSSTLRCAFVSHIVRPDGTRLDFDYAYNGSGAGNRARLRRVVSSSGYAILLEGGTNHVTKACVINLAETALLANGLCPTGAPDATYSYTAGNGALSQVVDAADATWGFSYTGNSIGFVRPGETTPYLVNQIHSSVDEMGAAQQVVDAQAFANGESYTYGWSSVPEADGLSGPERGGFFADAAGNETHYNYGFFLHPDSGFAAPCFPPYSQCPIPEPIPDSPWRYQPTPGPVEIIDPNGRVTTIDYCDPVAMAGLPRFYFNRCFVLENPVSFTDPEGITTFPSFDANRNVIQARRVPKPGSAEATSGPSQIVTSATYNVLNPIVATRPTSTTDANGNVTTYTYDQSHGGVLTETGPAVNGISPQTRHAYAQRYAWVSNGAGGYVQAAAPVWVRTSTSTCRTSAATGNPAAPCATAGDEVLTTYDYGPNSGPNNLQLRGQVVTAEGVSLRTCYRYDARGNRIAETAPAANLSTCS